MFTWKQKEAVVFDIVFRRIVTQCRRADWRYQVHCCSICRITGLVSSRPREFTLPSRTCEVRTTEDASPNFAYLVLRNGHWHCADRQDKVGYFWNETKSQIWNLDFFIFNWRINKKSPEKKINDLFCTHVYRTERPIQNVFGMNMYMVTPLFHIYISFIFSMI